MLRSEPNLLDASSSSAARAAHEPDAPHEPASPGNILSILQIGWRGRKRVGYFALAGLCLGVVAQLLLPVRYTSTDQIEIDFRRLINVNPNEATLNYRLSDAAIDSQTTIITSDGVLRSAVLALKLGDDPEFGMKSTVLTSVLAAIGLADDPASQSVAEREQAAIDLLGKAVKAERLGLSYVIEITATSSDAAKAVRIADAVTDAFIRDQQKARNEVATSAADWFQNRVNQLQENVAAAQKAAVDFRMQNQIMLAGGKYIDEIQVQDLSVRMIAAQERRVMAEARRERIEAVINGDKGVDGLLTGGLDDDVKNPVINGLIGRYHDIALRMAGNVARYGANHEAVLRDQGDMRELQKSVLLEFKRIAEGYKSEAEIAEKEQQALSGMLSDLAAHSTQSQRARIELIILQGAADSYTALRDKFVTEYSTSTQESSFPLTETRIVSRGIRPLRPTSPIARRTLVGGLALGLFGGVIAVFGREILSRKLRKRRQLEDATARRCLGYVPKTVTLKNLMGGHLDAAASTETADRLPEQTFRSILLHARSSACDVIGVVSSVRGDGSSTIATALSLVAANDRRVLIIDADSRSRALTRSLGAPATEGLLEALHAQTLDPYITRVGRHDRLWLLPNFGGGAADDMVFETAAIAKLVRQARDQFDLVILDLPPLSTTLDARALAGAVDGFILVAKWNATDLDLVVDALASNPEVQGRLLGGVFNQVDMKHADDLEDVAFSEMAKTMRHAHGVA